MARHIIHLAVKPRLQPFGQARLRVTQIDIRKADGVEAQRAAMRANALLELCGFRFR